jgi:hypothetical protein
VGDPTQYNVRGCVVLHQDPELLPRDLAKNTPGASNAPYVAVRLDTTDRQLFSYVMDGMGPRALAVDHHGSESLDEAKRLSFDWCGEAARTVPFANIPGVYQAAFISFITGREPELGELLLLWIQPDETGGHVLVRNYPPGLHQDERFDGKFMVVPVVPIRESQIKYGLR